MISYFKKYYLYFIISIYHFFFTIISYNYYLKNDGDASLYWFLKKSTITKSWFDFLNFGTDAFMFINYPLTKFLHFPIFFGFVIYSIIGLLGIFQFYKLIKTWIGEKLFFLGINIIPFLLFMPNLHFWTSILGKEPLMFLCITTVLIQILEKNYFSFKLFFSLLVILLIRPHLFLLLFFSIVFVLFFYEKWSTMKKTIVLTFSTVLLSISFFLFLKISKIHNFNWDKISRYNNFSLQSLKYSKSYIPMIEYSFPLKFFAFYFRPLFFDIHNFFGFVISIENLIILVLHIIAVYLFFKHHKIIKFDLLFKIILVYSIVSAFVYVQRYSDLGLIIRTKVLLQPYIIVALFWMMQQIKTKQKQVEE